MAQNWWGDAVLGCAMTGNQGDQNERVEREVEQAEKLLLIALRSPPDEAEQWLRTTPLYYMPGEWDWENLRRIALGLMPFYLLNPSYHNLRSFFSGMVEEARQRGRIE